jgi:radical SAM family uncharacterized protein
MEIMDYTIFQKPQRYIGNEYNVIKKTHSGKIKICISYPDMYELGMSNLGLRILYGLLNEFDDVLCERVFMPGDDLAEFLRTQKKDLFSLETKTPLCQFEVLGFNFNYELNYTNFLHILDLGGIPIKACERKDVIILGGGISNPEPVAEFVDVFFLGEFEETAQSFIEVLRKHKDKEDRLKALSQIDGFYVPKFYSSVFHENRYYFEKTYSAAKFPIKRVFVKNLDKSFYPRKWLTPHTHIIHDRVPMEIARGCPNRCVFCQARALYYPYRERSVSTIHKLIAETYQNSGYENFSLLSLSASDHSCIEGLIDDATDYFQERKIGLSLPSLRIDDILGRLSTKLNKIKKTSLTVAVEAAGEELRNRLNKKIDINKLLEAAKIIKALKIKQIKLYFMFGFPQETEEDLIAIGRFLSDLSRDSRLLLNVSINIFIPKPFSLWENVAMQTESELTIKRGIILKNIPRRRNIKLSLSFLKKSILEAVTARADRRFSSVIYRAFLKGARFDGYKEHFSWEIWKKAMEEEGIDYRFYLDAATENFPWTHIKDGRC